jgi:glycosyltransferase involved in cell wall biosynthesis
MYRVCINAANLHNGGGVQVATSFIEEMSYLESHDFEIHILASDEVFKNLTSLNVDVSVFNGFKVFNMYGLSALLPSVSRETSGYDLVFTVFGPDYSVFSGGWRMTGFAQAWITFPDNEVYKSLAFFEKIKIRFKFKIQGLFFKRSNSLIVELEHVKCGLVDKLSLRHDSVHVVHNCISGIYLQLDKWASVSVRRNKERFSIGFVGRDYVHKNTDIFPIVKSVLLDKYSLEVDFYVTFSEAEWAKKDKKFRSAVINAGVLTISECPGFYEDMDAVIFPSLLECFSASPLEALVMQKPLFASDRGFVKDVCGDYAWYFDPIDPESAADVIYGYISESLGRDEHRLLAAKKHALTFSSAKNRALSYLSLIDSALKLDRFGC